MQNKSSQITHWFYLFVTLHFLVWTLTPILIRHNLPMDAIEGALWGQQLEWGYDKNPFLNGWLTTLAIFLGGQSGWMIYAFSQLSVLICFVAIWKLANKILSSAYALLAVLLLEGMQYYNFHAIDFNDNTLELSLWALTIYFFYQSLQTPSKFSWILTGLFAGLGMMAKYYTATLILSLFLFLIFDEKNRQQLKTLSPYLGLCAFLIIILPHTIWLFYNDFITVTYVFDRASSEPHWTNHLFFPAQFFWQQFEVFIPSLILFLLLLTSKPPASSTETITITRFNKSFLLYAGLGPLLITLLLSFILGIKLRAGWGMPLLSLWPILLLAFFPLQLTIEKIKRFVGIIFIGIFFLIGGYTFSLTHAKNNSSANFPGKVIAATVTQMWRDTYHTKLNYVAGPRWTAGNVSFYSDDRPKVFAEWDQHKFPWFDVTDMQQKGGVFIWNITEDENLPVAVAKKFPQLTKIKILTFAWQRNENLPPIKIGVALLPPEKLS